MKNMKKIFNAICLFFAILIALSFNNKNNIQLQTPHNVIFWGKTAEIAEKYLQKGSQCAVQGKIIYDSYEDKDGNKKYYTQIRGNELLLLGKRENTASLVEEKEEALPF